MGAPLAQLGELERKALLKRLGAAGDARLIALLAPSGYGKTTLVAQFCRAVARKRGARALVWLTLTDDTSSPAALAQVLRAACVRDVPELPEAAWEAAEASGAVSERLALALGADLNAAEVNVTLVLDKTEWLRAAAAAWLEVLVNALAEGHQVLLAGFDTGVLPVARWQSRSDVLVLDAAELVFTDQETHMLMDKRGVESVPASVLEQLGGWPAALALALNGSAKNSSAKKQNRTRHFGATALALEAIKRLPSPLREVLPHLAPFEVWTQATPEAVQARLNADWLEVLVQAGLPLTRTDAHEFLPHALLLEALDSLLKLDAAQCKISYSSAAESAWHAGQWRRALKLYTEAGDSVKALEVAQPLMNQWAEQGEYQLQREALAAFPRTELTEDLMTHLARALTETGAVEEGAALMEELYQGGYRHARLFVALSATALKQGRYDQQLLYTQEGLDVVTDDLSKMRLLIAKTTALIRLSRPEEVLVDAREAMTIAARLGERLPLAQALDNLGVALGEVNQQSESEASFREALRVARAAGLTLRELATSSNLADFLMVWGKPLEALQVSMDAVRRCDAAPAMWQAMLYSKRALALMGLGQPDRALPDFQRSLEICEAHGLSAMAFMRRAWTAEAAALSGQGRAADGMLALAKQSMPSHSAVSEARWAFAAGLMAFISGDLIAAHTHLAAADVDALPAPDRARARAYLAALETMPRFEQAKRTFAILNDLGHDLSLVPDLPFLRGWLQVSASNHWFETRCHALLEWRSPEIVDAPRPVLSVQLLNQFAVTLNAKPVTIPYARSRELLAWLALNASGSREQIVTALFDGSRRQEDIEHFKVVVRRLRSSLAEIVEFNPVVFEQGRYQLNSQFLVNMDALEILNRDVANVASLEPVEFLPECYSEWASDARAILNNRIGVSQSLGADIHSRTH